MNKDELREMIFCS